MRVLLVHQETTPSDPTADRLAADGHEVHHALAAVAPQALADAAPDVVFVDLSQGPDGVLLFRSLKEKAAGRPFVVLVGHAGLKAELEAGPMPPAICLAKPAPPDDIAGAIRRAFEGAFPAQPVKRWGVHQLVGRSPRLRQVIDIVRKVSRTEASTILLRGESGTGKDVIAKAIHYESPNADHPFVNITCTALPDTLLESELFGYEKGAFTDARAPKKGLFELGDGGTIYLDEIGDMPPVLQAKLLRALEERAFRRIGGTQDIRVHARVIAATNRDLEHLVQEGKFREDLYYRLNVIKIDLPPLRERREDIPDLVEHFVNHFAHEFHRDVRGVTAEAARVLQAGVWHGNIRELRNVVERAVLLTTGPMVSAEDIQQPRTPASRSEGRLLTLPDHGIRFEDLERDLIIQALERTSGNQTRAGELLGMTREQIHYRIVKFALPYADRYAHAHGHVQPPPPPVTEP